VSQIEYISSLASGWLTSYSARHADAGLDWERCCGEPSPRSPVLTAQDVSELSCGDPGSSNLIVDRAGRQSGGAQGAAP
jgi:hypothetical protein